MALEQEIEAYRRKLPELLAHDGEYVVIHRGEVVGFFGDLDSALRAGYERTVDEEFLVRRVSESEPVLMSSWSLRSCPTSPSP